MLEGGTMRRSIACLLAMVFVFLSGAGCALVYYDAQDRGDSRMVEVGLVGWPHRSRQLPGLVPVFRSHSPLEAEGRASE
jgi:hypothetical protein